MLSKHWGRQYMKLKEAPEMPVPLDLPTDPRAAYCNGYMAALTRQGKILEKASTYMDAAHKAKFIHDYQVELCALKTFKKPKRKRCNEHLQRYWAEGVCTICGLVGWSV